jgi:hypothetical protein
MTVTHDRRAQFPVLQGKYKEFVRAAGRDRIEHEPKPLDPQAFRGHIPTQQNREFRSPNSEPGPSQQGIFHPSRDAELCDPQGAAKDLT